MWIFCANSEDNDLQVRDATRYLLNLYHSGDSWMAHRDQDERMRISDYNLLHKPWTGISGMQRRAVESPVRGGLCFLPEA